MRPGLFSPTLVGMKILIATGIYPPDIGGPAHYAHSLKEALEGKGYEVAVVRYTIEKRLPTGIRHLVSLVKLLSASDEEQCIIALDTFSMGIPALAVAKFLNKRLVVRVGGDFLWEHYVERTRERITLPAFYRAMPELSRKERMIFRLTKLLLSSADEVVFSTAWQRDIFLDPYEIRRHRTSVIGNAFVRHFAPTNVSEKKFLWAGRAIFLKNVDALRNAFDRVRAKRPDVSLEISGAVPHHELMEKIGSAYAVIIPSLSEVSPNFALEAIACGKPVIVTAETGIAEQIADAALLIDPLDVDDIANKILLLLDDAEYARKAEAARTISIVHTYDEIADEFIEVCKKPL